MGKCYTKPVIPTKANHELTDSEREGPWCYCQESIEGSMLIGCDNNDCKIMWFHMNLWRHITANIHVYHAFDIEVK